MIKTILYTTLGYVLAAVFSFIFFYLLTNFFATSLLLGGTMLLMCFTLGCLLVNYTDFIDDYQDSLEAKHIR